MCSSAAVKDTSFGPRHIPQAPSMTLWPWPAFHSSVTLTPSRCDTAFQGILVLHRQGSHMLEKYLNLEAFLEKSLKFRSALKMTGNYSKALKSPWILLFSVGLSTVDRDLNQYKIVVPLFGAANAAPNKGTTILYQFSSTNVSILSV